jgi:hypothetical protein
MRCDAIERNTNSGCLSEHLMIGQLTLCRSTNALSQASQGLQNIQGGAVVFNNALGIDPTVFFEEIFEACQSPNAAEVEFLSRMSGLPEFEVQSWCKSL